MKKITIKRNELPEMLRCIIGIDQKGKVKFNEWLKINESLVSLRTRAKVEEEILQKIRVNTGYEAYLESIKRAELKRQEDYIHTEIEIDAIEKFKKQHKEFLESEIEVEVNMIPQSLIEDLPKEALEFRSGLMKIVEIKKGRDQPKKND